MAQITCRFSGVVFNCEHMPMGLSGNEYHHPLFSVPKKKLLGLTSQWAANRLSPTESYLLYLSLLHSTDLIIWRASARYTEKTASVIANNMEHLVQIIGKIDLITHPHFVLPKFAITYDTGDLKNSFYWIQTWVSNYKEFMEDFIDAQHREELKIRIDRRESALQRIIKDPNASPVIKAKQLAEWAADAGNFPEGDTPHPFKKEFKSTEPLSLSISEYWQEIIRAAVKEDAIWKYPQSDIDELIEHCVDNIEHGSLYAHDLMKVLREGSKKKKDYTGFGDVDLAGKTTSFKLLDANASAEQANIIAAIQSAPDSEPVRTNYPTLGAFIKAKCNWDMKKRMGGP